MNPLINTACEAVIEAIEAIGGQTWPRGQRSVLDALHALCGVLKAEGCTLAFATAEEAEITVRHCLSIDDLESVDIPGEIERIRRDAGRGTV